jgi:hypothetical protein
MYKVRNDADFFKFIDCFGVKYDYLYKTTMQFGENTNKRNLKERSIKNIFD